MKKKIDFIKSANNFSFNPFSEVASKFQLNKREKKKANKKYNEI